MVWAPPTVAGTGTIQWQNVYSVGLYKLCVPTLVLLSQSEGLVWYAAALLATALLVYYCHFTILQWLKNCQPFCTKGDDFYQEILVIFRRNTCFEWHYSTAFIIGWRPFWTPTTMADTGTISHASISENIHSIAMYICTNFGAFIKKWTIALVCHCTIRTG